VTVTSVDADGAVDAARSGTVGCLVAPANPDDVALADLLERVRDHRPALPVVLVGDGETGVPPGAVEAGVDDYVALGDDDRAGPVAAVVDEHRHGMAVPEERVGRLHSALVENVSDVLVTVDREGYFEYLSPAVEHVLDWSPDELVGEHSMSLVHPDDRAGVAEFFGDPAEWVGERRSHTFRFDDGTGDHVVVEAIAQNLLDDPAVGGVVLNCRDVTDREHRERELELYETIVETVPVGLFVIDEESNIDHINQAGVDTVDGKTETELRDTSVLDLITEGYFDASLADKYVAGVRDLLSADTDADRFVEDIAYHPPDDGETQFFNVHWGLRPFEDEFRGTVVAFQNVTDRKRYEEDLERQNERLERFTQFVSHDLRNPLNVAKGYAVQARETDDERSMREVEVSLDRMEQLIEELLTMAREGRAVAETVAVDLDEAAREAWRTVATGDATLEADDATVSADPGQLRQALENLFRNAVDHAGDGVTVCVGARDGGGFYVEDDGPGIPDEEREAVLELGYTTTSDGTGFGLGIVAQVADAHDWTVTVAESATGGARFEFAPEAT
jgi:PAS domain S-box-containing protein